MPREPWGIAECKFRQILRSLLSVSPPAEIERRPRYLIFVGKSLVLRLRDVDYTRDKRSVFQLAGKLLFERLLHPLLDSHTGRTSLLSMKIQYLDTILRILLIVAFLRFRLAAPAGNQHKAQRHQ